MTELELIKIKTKLNNKYKVKVKFQLLIYNLLLCLKINYKKWIKINMLNKKLIKIKYDKVKENKCKYLKKLLRNKIILSKKY